MSLYSVVKKTYRTVVPGRVRSTVDRTLPRQAAVMRAVQIHKYGGPRVLVQEEAPQPEPQGGDLLVRVHAASVNPADWQIRAGRRDRLKRPFSLILGFDVSGVVEAVGGGAAGFQTGDAVFGMVDVRAGGAYAEYVTAPAENFAPKPHSLDHVQASALPVAGLTAWGALFEAGQLTAGQKVLIHAAAGGVGHIAVQLAKWKGAYVIGTASRRNERLLKDLGVDQFIDYTTQRFEDLARDVDVVLESINRDIPLESYRGETLDRSWGVLKKGGVLVSLCTVPSSATAARHGVRAKYGKPPAHKGPVLRRIGQLVDAGFIKPVVSMVLPLEEVREAHKQSHTGHVRGKIVLNVIGADS